MKVVALSGRAGAGKDFIANELVEKHGFVRMAFADTLKQMMALMLGVSIEDVNRLKVGEIDTELRSRLPASIRYLPSREIAHRTRVFLQVLGTDNGRKVFADDVWVWRLDAAIHKRRQRVDAGLDTATKGIVITDARFPNEFEMLTRIGATTVWVDAPAPYRRLQPTTWVPDWIARRWPDLVYRVTKNPAYHPSETALLRLAENGAFDVYLWNNRTDTAAELVATIFDTEEE